MSSFANFGNDLYTGKRSFDIVGRQKTWYTVSLVLLILASIGLFGRGLNVGLEFKGGSEFRVSSVTNIDNFEARGKTAVGTLDTGTDVVVTKIGTDTVRIQTEKFQNTLTDKVKSALASEFKVSENKITASTIGASWGASVSQKAVKALIVFLILVSLVLAAYFRTWKMSLAALIALAHDLVITVGIYALAGFEVTPASVIGFLTILGYSLYDTVVVFDKVRENTLLAAGSGRLSFSQAANQAVNQTLVRSINTSVVALLPVGSILFIGFFLLGPGTLLDLSLALFVGIAVGTYSSIFIATPVLADLREREPVMAQQKKHAERYQAGQARQAASAPAVSETGMQDGPDLQDRASVSAGNGTSITGRPLHPSVQTGPRNQPKRPPKSKR
ncbi:MAG: protein translocase subunit SecF [Phycicoccus sp.]|nr:protein translocase subunit SecF [Phycicoccus sp.]NMM34134.1 protein translocase subunit SecF [Phycicoccus sp.]